jgi:hypothetical protein
VLIDAGGLTWSGWSSSAVITIDAVSVISKKPHRGCCYDHLLDDDSSPTVVHSGFVIYALNEAGKEYLMA